MNYQGSVISAQEKELLLARAQTGDREALNLLFESCRGSLYRRALRILPRPQDAEDAVQEAMLAAFTRFHQFQGRANFLTWATRIVINAALQHIRKARTRATIALDHADVEFEGPSFAEFLRDAQPNPEEQLRVLEQRELFEDALHNLPVEMRQAIRLCKVKDYSLQEAASMLGLPEGTLKARLHRAKRALMVHLKRQAQDRPKAAAGKRSLQLCSEESLCAA